MGEINIKRNVINIIIFVLVFSASALIVNGTETNINENTIYIIKNLSEYEKNIEDMRNVVEGLRAQVDSEKNFLKEHENNNFLDDIIDINSQIEELKFYNGFTDVRGPGIMMSVSDSTIDDDSIDIMEKIVHDVDITVLLNDLKNAGAEAIDVNSQRIINISEVVCAGPVLKINGEAVPAPFIIKAIGDMDSLYNAVTEEGTYAYELKNNYGMEVVVVKHYNQPIPKYKSNNYKAEYAESIER
jgi:uncharacterized protein YlxW (UPF0749 family)